MIHLGTGFFATDIMPSISITMLTSHRKCLWSLRTDITMAKTQRTKGQIMIYKTFQTTD
jgi:hypothetical protein